MDEIDNRAGWYLEKEGNLEEELDKYVFQNYMGYELTLELFDEMANEYLICIHGPENTTEYTAISKGTERAIEILNEILDNPEWYGIE